MHGVVHAHDARTASHQQGSLRPEVQFRDPRRTRLRPGRPWGTAVVQGGPRSSPSGRGQPGTGEHRITRPCPSPRQRGNLLRRKVRPGRSSGARSAPAALPSPECRAARSLATLVGARKAHCGSYPPWRWAVRPNVNRHPSPGPRRPVRSPGNLPAPAAVPPSANRAARPDATSEPGLSKDARAQAPGPTASALICPRT
jgi:hypothetical protein